MLFHDGGRENRLEQQVWGPLLAANEMGNPSIGYVLSNLARWPEYQGRFEAAFGSAANMENVGHALAAYQRTLIAGGSAFDRWYYAHDENASSAEARRGFKCFAARAIASPATASARKPPSLPIRSCTTPASGFLRR